jgi:lysophospholipid acyltransferase (LPLAT)-like uncharacterized protein
MKSLAALPPGISLGVAEEPPYTGGGTLLDKLAKMPVKLRHPGLIRLVALLLAVVVRLWLRTLRLRIVWPPDGLRHPTDPRRQRFIYAFWHEALLFPAAFTTRIHVLISQHADGELIAQVCRHLGYGLVRGSTNRQGTQALLQLLRVSQDSHLLITPDGPRGPRRRVQRGLVFVASRTGLPVVACGVAYCRAWRARSWDRFAVPWPWSTAVCVVAPALRVPADLNRAGLEQYRRLLEEQMLAVTAAAERLAGAPAEAACPPHRHTPLAGETPSCLDAASRNSLG